MTFRLSINLCMVYFCTMILRGLIILWIVSWLSCITMAQHRLVESAMDVIRLEAVEDSIHVFMEHREPKLNWKVEKPLYDSLILSLKQGQQPSWSQLRKGYHQLTDPVSNGYLPHLVVIADPALWAIPFEMLLSQDHQPYKQDVDQAYWIKSHMFSYHQSYQHWESSVSKAVEDGEIYYIHQDSLKESLVYFRGIRDDFGGTLVHAASVSSQQDVHPRVILTDDCAGIGQFPSAELFVLAQAGCTLEGIDAYKASIFPLYAVSDMRIPQMVMKQLFDGHRKSEALALAQRAYLKKPYATAAPLGWVGWRTVGDIKSIDHGAPQRFYLILMLGIVLMYILVRKLRS